MDGAKLVAARKSRFWSQERAAEELKVGRVTFYRWEQGETTPQGEHLLKDP